MTLTAASEAAIVAGGYAKSFIGENQRALAEGGKALSLDDLENRVPGVTMVTVVADEAIKQNI